MASREYCKTSLSEFRKAWRAKGIKDVQVAEFLGIARSTIAKWNSKDKLPLRYEIRVKELIALGNIRQPEITGRYENDQWLLRLIVTIAQSNVDLTIEDVVALLSLRSLLPDPPSVNLVCEFVENRHSSDQ